MAAEGPAGTARIYSATTYRDCAGFESGAGIAAEAASMPTVSIAPINESVLVMIFTSLLLPRFQRDCGFKIAQPT
jgi:hypothetical protein